MPPYTSVLFHYSFECNLEFLPSFILTREIPHAHLLNVVCANIVHGESRLQARPPDHYDKRLPFDAYADPIASDCIKSVVQPMLLTGPPVATRCRECLAKWLHTWTGALLFALCF